MYLVSWIIFRNKPIHKQKVFFIEISSDGHNDKYLLRTLLLVLNLLCIPGRLMFKLDTYLSNHEQDTAQGQFLSAIQLVWIHRKTDAIKSFYSDLVSDYLLTITSISLRHNSVEGFILHNKCFFFNIVSFFVITPNSEQTLPSQLEL